MYRHEDCEQLKLELPFGVTLREDNRWVILSKLFPWEAIEQEYAKNFTGEEGQVALPSRLAFGALYIQTSEHYTDEQTRRNIQENPYLQYFCGFECYTMESPFDASMMTYFRKRIQRRWSESYKLWCLLLKQRSGRIPCRSRFKGLGILWQTTRLYQPMQPQKTREL